MSKRFKHDNSYKNLFSDPAMVKALLIGFIHPELLKHFDLNSLETQNGSYIADDLRDREDDIKCQISSGFRRNAGKFGKMVSQA